MSVQPASESVRPAAHVAAAPQGAADDALEFVRFCYRRRRVGWPVLYDEMSVVAARAAFRGLGYGDLAERGISFCLEDLPRMAALTERVVAEEERRSEPQPGSATIALALAALNS